MASGNIKGITIEIGGDTTGLDKALKGVNSTIKDTQKELKEVDKALKLDPGNTELLEQKQRKLADAVQATSEKLNTLKDAQQQAQDQLERGEISQAQYDALTREIVQTEAALKDAKAAQDSFNVSIEKAKAKLDAVGSAAKKVQDKTKALSGAAAGLIGGITALGVKSLQTADDLATLSQQTGISTDELQRMQYASEMVDVSVSDMTGAMAKLKKQMATSGGQDALRELGVSVIGVGGHMRDAELVFYDVLEALSQIENETERDQAAMEIFGKSADSLAGIIDDGGASLKEYGDKAAELGLILDTETLNGLNDVKDKVDELKAQAAAELAKTGAAAIEALTPVIEILVEKLSALFEWIGSLDAETLQIILTIAAVVAAISPIAGLIAGVTGAINGLLALWPAVKAAGLAIKAFAAANPILLIITVIAALAAAVYANWDKIKPVLEAAWEKVKEVAGNIQEKFQALKDALTMIFASLKGYFEGVWTSITDTIKTKVNTVIGYVNSAISAINSLISAANNSGIGKALGLNIGTIGTIPEMQTSGSKGGTINTTNNTVNYNTSSQPMQVNVQLDSRTMARALVAPLGQQMSLAGNSNVF